MADETLDNVAERLVLLEVTVAQGFHDEELRELSLNRMIDVTAEALRSDIRNVLDAVTSLGVEMRRTTDMIRKEHAADRAVHTLALEQHARRLHDLEGK